MRHAIHLGLAALLVLAFAPGASANASFEQWLRQMRNEATAQGVSGATFDAAFTESLGAKQRDHGHGMRNRIGGIDRDLPPARSMARRLGVPFEPVVFERNAEVLEGGKAGRVDLVFTNATAERAKFLDFSPTVLEIEQGYLVPRGSAIASAADVDRSGVRVGVSQGSTSQGVLAKELRNAVVVPTPNLKAAAEMLSAGKLDAFATNKAILFELGDKVPGSRVLDGRWGMERFSFGIPKGRDAALPLLGELVAGARADGTVAKAAQRAGVRGTPASAD